MFSFVTKEAPFEALEALLNGLEFFGLGYSWGGFESLAMAVDPTKMRTATAWDEKGHLIRLHVGLEDPSDFIEDLRKGFQRFSGIA